MPYIGDGNWILSDISGRQIKTNYIANGEKVMELNLSDLPSGTYFITIQLGGNVSTAKIVKMQEFRNFKFGDLGMWRFEDVEI